ncbi:multidrug resistance protein 4 [Armillaria novae-zelandiae]|uniref:Multidrug resistance protein 4 n=1 Tax=Armillaria novae-zelandiae TaxID=153914 RepID=A0AA39UD12_9AGAR|nr:multidrug resistance protein 4 [Armillaria novae-zelandiae]
MVEDEAHDRAPSVYSTRALSTHSSITLPPGLQRIVPPGQGESAIAVDPKQEELKQYDDDWEVDPRNPRNWALGRKWLMVSIVSLYTFVSPLASSTMAPGLPLLAERYHITNETVIALTLSIFLLAFALGPLILGPLSEMYGRTWAFNMGCAYAPNTGTLIGFRLLAGLSGSAPIACGGGTVGDLFSERDRASAMALYSLGPLVGPAIGPVAGGFIANFNRYQIRFRDNRRYMVPAFPSYSVGSTLFLGMCLLSGIFAVPLLEETYAPVIRERIAKRSGDLEKAAHFHNPIGEMGKLEYLWINISRPVILLFRSFICFILSLYMAFMYGIYYLMFTTFPTVFNEIYGFNIGVGGLVYLGIGIGFLTASAFGAKTADQIYHYLAKRDNNGVGKPEMRIPALFFGSLFVPVGLFWYGWSAQAKIHWIMPIIGSGIFGFGTMTTFIPIQLYLVDTFKYAASALAAASVFRSLLGFAFPLFGDQMFNALGLGGGNSLLAGLAILLGIPFPIWIYYKGEAVRLRSDLSR